MEHNSLTQILQEVLCMNDWETLEYWDELAAGAKHDKLSSPHTVSSSPSPAHPPLCSRPFTAAHLSEDE